MTRQRQVGETLGERREEGGTNGAGWSVEATASLYLEWRSLQLFLSRIRFAFWLGDLT